jgi:hypothetical protein
MIRPKFFFDTEFMEDGKSIELLSIGVVDDIGRKFYAENADADWSHANAFVKTHVLPYLSSDYCKPRKQIAAELLEWVNQREGKPEFWAYYASYDWVVLCQLFGRMVDLPEGWPMFVNDLKQLHNELGSPELPKQQGGHHHALADAIWVREAWEHLRGLPSN